jgi:hypothetical protein
MKPEKFVKKLQLKKQQIATLNPEETFFVKGGTDESIPSGCTGITCEYCNSDVSCEIRKCDICGS